MVIYILAIPKRSLSTLDLPGSMEEPATCVLMTQTPKAKKNDKSIEELVRWLGFKPLRVTYSNDYFDRLYELAEALIQRDKAYAQRGVDAAAGTKGKARYACPHRDRPVAESLAEFRAMQGGKYRAQPAVLRMKQDLANGNPQMWDITAYRVVEDDEGGFCKHLRTGDKWKIYPSYDFTHCLCDSLKTSPNSLCTTEFELSRESYEWLCDALEVYKPMQREYGRLNMNGTVLSKRKLIILISGKLIQFHSRTLSISTAVISGKPLQNFYRLSPGVSVSFMKVPFPITATSYESDPTTGLVTVVRAKYEIPEEGSPRKKPKSSEHPGPQTPATKENEMEDESGTLRPNGPESVRFQGMRVAYFCEDKDSTAEKVVLNMIVTEGGPREGEHIDKEAVAQLLLPHYKKYYVNPNPAVMTFNMWWDSALSHDYPLLKDRTMPERSQVAVVPALKKRIRDN
ncbi:glutaminyl-tRNA synthetase [Blastomyces gilchristii SLH14081]|uniref:glutamine--tRNA ligase n=1 Tax=Blastomyces gilchristii (strain SLH14081) TaxID=559298 RepID=A0A179UYE2_BLAGS|nr:glutaminyl-tRNA synthetase [Blastomyces gilchristii SLH14081]OAT13115.1 glutaminyl-tRNA synthetase [Blastomyces gilchristii SLH14081]